MTSKASFALAAVVLTLTVAPAGSQTFTPIEFPGARVHEALRNQPEWGDLGNLRES